MMVKLCCISVTLGTQFIGAFDLSSSVLAITFIIKELFMDEQKLAAFDDIDIILGLGWMNKSTNSQRRFNYKLILVCLMVYSIFHLICSAGLILATIFRKKAYATPWLTFEMISLASQASRVAVHIFQRQGCDKMGIVGSTSLPVGNVFLLLILGTYFWFVVFVARKSWSTETSDKLNQSTLIKSYAVKVNSTKTPSSILLENHSIFESSDPCIPSK